MIHPCKLCCLALVLTCPVIPQDRAKLLGKQEDLSGFLAQLETKGRLPLTPLASLVRTARAA